MTQTIDNANVIAHAIKILYLFLILNLYVGSKAKAEIMVWQILKYPEIYASNKITSPSLILLPINELVPKLW